MPLPSQHYKFSKENYGHNTPNFKNLTKCSHRIQLFKPLCLRNNFDTSEYINEYSLSLIRAPKPLLCVSFLTIPSTIINADKGSFGGSLTGTGDGSRSPPVIVTN